MSVVGPGAGGPSVTRRSDLFPSACHPFRRRLALPRHPCRRVPTTLRSQTHDAPFLCTPNPLFVGRMAGFLYNPYYANVNGWRFPTCGTPPDFVRLSPMATADPTAATLFLADICIMGRGKQGEWSKSVVPFIQGRPDLRERYQRDGGKNFAVILTSDHGPCPNFYEKGLKQGHEAWHAPELASFTKLMNEGSLLSGCYDRAHDMTIPSPAALGALSTEECTDEVRQSLVFFSGQQTHQMRVHLYELYADDPDFFLPRTIDHAYVPGVTWLSPVVAAARAHTSPPQPYPPLVAAPRPPARLVAGQRLPLRHAPGHVLHRAARTRGLEPTAGGGHPCRLHPGHHCRVLRSPLFRHPRLQHLQCQP